MKYQPVRLLGAAVTLAVLLSAGCNKPATPDTPASAAAGAATAVKGGPLPPKLAATPASPVLAHDIDAYKSRHPGQ